MRGSAADCAERTSGAKAPPGADGLMSELKLRPPKVGVVRNEFAVWLLAGWPSEKFAAFCWREELRARSLARAPVRRLLVGQISRGIWRSMSRSINFSS